MAKNKIIYGNETLIDLTDDTVSANNLLSGATAHDRSGTQITGSVTVPSDLDDLSDVNISSLQDGQILQYDNNTSKWVNTDALKDKMDWEANSFLGAKNLIPLSLAHMKEINTDGTWNDNVYTLDGITFTVNEDSNGNVTDIVVDGTYTSAGYKWFYCTAIDDSFCLPENTYTLNGCPSGGSDSTYWLKLQARTNTGTTTWNTGDYGNGVTADILSSYKIQIVIQIGAVYNPDNLVFKPMFRLASDTDDVWQPYAMTNQELTQEIRNAISGSQSDWNQTDTTASDYIKNKPTIPAAQVNSDWDSSSGISQILNKPTLATVATSGSYSDLSDKPWYLYAGAGSNVASLNDLVNLMNNSANQRSCTGTIKVTTDIGIGLTGWARIFAIAQNAPNNGSYDLGMFCMFFPADTTNVKYALINGKTTGNYTVACIGQIPTGLQRVTKSCNALPGANGVIFEEYTSGTNYNLPSNAYYHIISMQGPDNKYGTQLALGMNTSGAYYRNYNNGTWGSWTSIVNTNAITGVKGSADSSYTTSGQVNLGASNVGALPISGGTLTGNLTVARANTGTSSVDSVIQAGNGTASGTAGCTRGYLRLYGTNAYGAQLLPPNDNTAMRNYTLPTVTGNKTLAYYGENVGDFTNNVGYITSSGSCASATTAVSCKDANLTYCYLSSGTAILQGNSGKAVWLQIKDLNWKVVFQADGNLVVYQGNTAKWSTNTSSRRFKHNIQAMTEERARKILDIRPVTFDWNEDQPITTRQYDNAGVIAEEVANVCPDLVVFEGEDHTIARRVEYERFTPYLIKMVQTQQQEIDLLKQEVEILKQEVRLLKGE